jgi:DNA helicase-2/ATP-dependent DNA helicase PcrA
MTVHGSKGLEFDEVYIIGAAQGIFPGRGDLQEERRLFGSVSKYFKLVSK